MKSDFRGCKRQEEERKQAIEVVCANIWSVSAISN
jgi:hypothetical protein